MKRLSNLQIYWLGFGLGVIMVAVGLAQLAHSSSMDGRPIVDWPAALEDAPTIRLARTADNLAAALVASYQSHARGNALMGVLFASLFGILIWRRRRRRASEV